ncbi:MAG: FHA domain-containing protein [candidate division Zixibacteria bacterium]|nr:FHA domain-containing protein [candidate division Zixibacteria bacterium]
MAKFIVLKNGMDHKVFNFDGNIARVGSGSTVDFQLETAGIEGDLFFIAKTPSGYEIERRASDLAFTINGAAASDRTLLNEGDKVGFLDYIMIVKYQQQEQPIFVSTAPPEPEAVTPKPIGQGTAPAAPIVESKPEPTPAPETPRPAPKGAARATMIIDSQALAQQARTTPPPENRDRSVAAPVRPEPPAARPEQPKASKKQKITSVYTLCMLTGQHKGRAFEIDTQEFVIGRERALCDLVIDHDEHGQPEMAVSREHCAITSTDEGLYLTDKRSQLRTYINRKIIEPGQREFIAPEDIISIPAPTGEVFVRLCFRGQENFAPMSFAGPINPRLIAIMAAVIVILIIALYLMLR